MAKEAACSACEGCAQSEGHYLILSSVNAHGIGCDFVFTNCQAAATQSGVFKVLNEENDGHHNPEGISEGSHTGDTHKAGGTAYIVDIKNADTDNFAKT